MMATTTLALQAARAYTQAGLCVIPIRTDGSKSPAVPEWTTYKNRLPTLDEAERLFGQSEVGVAVICGKVSGNLETLDFETVEVYEQWKDLVKNVQPNLVGKLVITETPGKYGPHGRHVRYRIADMDVPGNMKLAMNETGKECLIETRGEGGYALAPGSALRAHPTGQAYKNIQGVLSGIKTITAKERRVLISCAESLNQHVKDAGEKHNYIPPEQGNTVGDRPGDIYNQRGDFSLLQKHGWILASQMANKCYWKRPGKDGPGISATSGYCKGADGTARLYVFSTNAEPFEAEKCYSPFSVYTLLEHGGDFSKAAVSLAKTYGKVTISSTVPDEVKKPKQAQEPFERELFPVGVFPEPLQHTIDEIARVIGCPTDSVGTLMLALASIGIGNTRKIALKRTWKESASLYLAVVAFPGEGKSPVMQELAAPLYAWQHGLHEQHKQKMLDHAKDKEKHEEDKKAGNESDPPPAPVYPHVYTTDATTEKLAEILDKQPRGIGMSQDEVTALVQGMNQYKAGKGRDRQFFLSAWSGSPCKVDRKNNPLPLIVTDPYITIFGGIQPEMLGALKDEFGREDGFVHRFLFSYPPLRQLQPWGGDEISQKAINDWAICFNRLITLSQHIDAENKLRPWICMLDPMATVQWKEWYDKTIQTMESMEPQFRGPYHKLIAYAARLSLIMQMLYWATGQTQEDRIIEARSVWAGCALANYFANHLRLVYTRLHDQPDDTKANDLVELIKKNGGKMSARQVARTGPRGLRKTSAIIKSFQDLEDRGFGKYFESQKNNINGKSEKWFELSEENHEQ